MQADPNLKQEYWGEVAAAPGWRQDEGLRGPGPQAGHSAPAPGAPELAVAAGPRNSPDQRVSPGSSPVYAASADHPFWYEGSTPAEK